MNRTSFLARWTLVVTLGLVAAILFSTSAGVAGLLAPVLRSPSLTLALMLAASGLAGGAVLAEAEWWALRRSGNALTGWWFTATSLGTAAALAVAAAGNLTALRFELDPRQQVLVFIGLALAGGAALGGVQWLVLRRNFAHAGWWVPTNALAWAAGGTIVAITLRAVLETQGVSAIMGIAGLAVVVSLAIGLITGAEMWRLTVSGRTHAAFV